MQFSQFSKLISIVLSFFPIVLFGQIAVESTVVAATIYNQGAKVTRSAEIDVPAGESELKLTGLYHKIDENSIQLKFAKEGIRLINIYYTMDYLNPQKPDTDLKLVRDSLNNIQAEIAWLDKKIKVLEGEENVIKSNTKLTEKSTALISDLQELTKFYRERILEISKSITELKKEKNALRIIANRYQNQLNYNNRQEEAVGVIYCKILSNAPFSTELELNYFIKNAWWKPSYEIRSTGLDRPISVTYKAALAQSTGMDWEEIPLILSNARPTSNNTMPELEPIFAAAFPLNDVVSYDTIISFDPETYEERIEIVKNEKKWSETLKTQTSTQFKLDFLQSMKGDGKGISITVKELEISADYQYSVVPGKSNLAYLVAKIPEYGQYNFMPGYANLFFENTFLGKSYLDNQMTSDTLNLSLGIDYGVVVERKRKTFSAPKFIGNTVKETIDFEIKIRNNKSEPITINVLDQIPVSTEKAIEIKLLNKDGASFDEGTGKLKWKRTIPANTTETVDFSYQLKYPKSVRVAGKW